MAPHGFILLALAVNSMALSESHMEGRSLLSGRARAVPETCSEPGLFCSSCQMSYLCTAAGATPTELPCNAEQVCGGTAPASGCRDYVGASAGDCDCDTIGNVGFLADPYDSSFYFICIPPESQIQLECPAGEVFSSDDNGCIVEPTTAPSTLDSGVVQQDSSIDCTSQEIGFYTNDPTCQTYTACYIVNLPGLTLSCADGEAFDTSALQCVPQCDLGPATFECDTGDTGAFPDTSDCTIFHVCSNGLLVTPATGISCPNGQVFESTSMTCVAFTSDVVCPEINSCYAAYCDSCGGTCPETPTTLSEPSTTEPTPFILTTHNPNTAPSPTTTISPTTAEPEGPTTTEPATTPEPSTTPTTTSSTTTTTTTTTTVPTTTAEPELSTTEAATTEAAPTAAVTGAPDCNNSPGYYEEASDCKQFWSCQDDDAGGYEAIQYRCPGSLVYIPSFQYCSFQSDLATAPGCITS